MDFLKSHFRNPPTALGATANPPKSDDKYAQKSVQLVRGSSFRSDFLQNPYFRDRSSILPFKPLTFSFFFSMDGDFLSKQTILSPLKAFENYEISAKEARTYLYFQGLYSKVNKGQFDKYQQTNRNKKTSSPFLLSDF